MRVWGLGGSLNSDEREGLQRDPQENIGALRLRMGFGGYILFCKTLMLRNRLRERLPNHSILILWGVFGHFRQVALPATSVRGGSLHKLMGSSLN